MNTAQPLRRVYLILGVFLLLLGWCIAYHSLTHIPAPVDADTQVHFVVYSTDTPPDALIDPVTREIHCGGCH